MAYQVQRGETYLDIAKKLNLTPNQLVQLNPEAWKNGAYKYAGTTLRTKAGEKLGKQNSPVASAASGKAIIDSIIKNTKQIKDFQEVLKYSDFFNTQLANDAIAQQTEKYFAPQIDQGIEDIKGQYSNRGLLRSGIRGQQEGKFLTDIADQEATMRGQLFNRRDQEARQAYSNEQTRYEADPTGYKGSTPTSGGYVPYQPQSYQQIVDSYGNSQSENAPYKYRQSYMDLYKKLNPGTNY